MGKRIVYIKGCGYGSEQGDYNLDFVREGIASLRGMLPVQYDGVGDPELRRAWEDFSENFYCAGFLHVDESSVEHFAAVTTVENVVEDAGEDPNL